MKKIILFLIFSIIFLFQGLCLADEVIADFNNDTLPVLNNVLRKLRNDINIAGAPKGATYLTQTANTALTNEQALSSLSTGPLKVTTGTGIVSSGNIIESEMTFSNNTVNDVSTSKHGFCPRLDNNTTHFLNGQGNWTEAPSIVTFSYSGTKVFDDTSPTTFTDLNLSSVVGSNRSLVMLYFVQTNQNINITWNFRRNGDSAARGWEYILPMNEGQYVFVETDSSGIIEWKTHGQCAASITALSYIK